jgi:uncharacterized protein YjbI with pentapeptide repeats/beta-lactamase regulating signal transducer with metallopeptidase domain
VATEYQAFITFASALAATALNALWQDALLVLCVWLLLRAWPRINAATRYVVWSTTLVAALVVPVATTFAFFAPPQTLAGARPVVAERSSQPRPRAAAAAQEQPRMRAFVSAPQAPRLPQRMRVTLPVPFAIAVFAVWLVLVGYALGRLVVGLVRLEQLKRDALPLPIEYRDGMPQWLRANKGARDVRLCVSDETDVPVAVGLFDAMILIPRSLLERLSKPEVDQICLHELAHLRRADDWTNGLQRIINALLGWNPAALFVGQQLDLEREVACDDWVLSFVGSVRPYALCLTKMAESSMWPRNPIPAPGVFATRKHISLRIERLLGAGRNIATNLAVPPSAAAVGIVGAIALVITFVSPSIAASYVIEVPPVHVSVPPVRVSVPAVHVSVPAVHASVPATQVSVPVPETHVSVPSVHLSVPAMHVTVPAVKVAVPGVSVSVPPMNVTMPGRQVAIPKVRVSVPEFNSKGLSDQISQQVNQRVGAALGSMLRGSEIAQTKSCIGCDYSGVNWAGKDLRGVSYNGANFSKANLAGVNFSESKLLGVDFTGANLGGASFRNAHLNGCDFSDANLSGADFSGAAISGCQFTRARLGSSQLRDVLSGCTGCDFRHADLAGLDLRGVHTSGDDFSGADLRDVNLAGAQLVGADFSNAKLDGANLAGATFNGCNLSGVDLSHVDISRTKMIGTDFSTKQTPP